MTASLGAPAINIVGSFFPAWMLCAVVGIVVAVLVRQLLVAVRLDAAIPLAPLTHLAIAASATLGVWLVWFAH